MCDASRLADHPEVAMTPERTDLHVRTDPGAPPSSAAASARLPARVGLLGAGVIGGGWAARFLLNGVDVQLFDPDPESARKVGEMLDGARVAMRSLVLAPLPAEGRLTVVETPQEAATGVEFVQESAPERVDLKRDLLAVADSVADPATVIASSTSGLPPSRLAAGMRYPQRLCVGHPFNPVYLLPLVEVVGGRDTDARTLETAATVYRSVGMHPLRVRHEVDGFVADRLLEALWREALWLVADGVATVSEVDDAIRFGAGLRWAAMGTFLTYRIAGGEAGMRHFISQFGPALHWPWSKLTDVPELTDELIDRLVAQSDEQAGGRTVRELEGIRDGCLVAVLQGLRSQGVGAGATVAEYERQLLDRVHDGTGAAAARGDLDGPDGAAGPLAVYTTRIPAAWIDYNGHLHESRYLQVFGDATDALLRHLGVDAAYLAGGHSYFTAETRLAFRRAVAASDVVEVRVQVLGADEKRIHAYLEMLRDGEPVATAEHLYLHVDTVAQRATPAPPDLAERVRRLALAHVELPWPADAGRRIAERAPWVTAPVAP
jgi:carnitine 3-dehydrogenase